MMSKPLPAPRVAGTSCGPSPAAGIPSGCGRAWLILLLAAYISSSSCFKLRQAAKNVTIKIDMLPMYPVIGINVQMIPRGSSKGIISCTWSRGDKSASFPILTYTAINSALDYKVAYTGRETIGPDCSLQIKHIGLEDTDFYTLHKTTTNASEVGKIALFVRDHDLVPRAVNPVASIGIAAACFVGLAFLIGIFTYQFADVAPPRVATVPQIPGSHHSKILAEKTEPQPNPSNQILPGT